ncbi:hypothetical protein [Nonomuraea dietziae]|jgi:hypothetical protein|uniref:HEPN domain-containing protein n=1 Tax=Nonomuraea dietziae TaxID=65515 RepID=A0A7W5V9Y7_9ACTN|nr:hypothetical protein [Nonomuraea dietziae]MBB3729830.1 hypothetical protein [Nonomuraea dietziae]
MQGRDQIDAMLSSGQLERVPPSRQHADTLIAQAERHLGLAHKGAETDPTGAYQLLYDASRKALASILENQGLRATSRGGHLAVLDAVTAQLDPPLGQSLRSFDRMRRRRNNAEYPRLDTPEITSDDVTQDMEKAKEFVALAAKVLDQMSPY